MLLGRYYDGIEIHREERIIYARFLVPHRVISTCRVAGGLRDDLHYLYNHQASEPSGGHHLSHSIAISDPSKYRALICGRYGLPAEQCATLGTAANMRNAVIQEAHFRDLTVVAVCTGGVEGNAGRVGDPASVYEHDGLFERLSREDGFLEGTINIMLFINQELIPGAMVRAVMTATEAKTSVLQELSVPSRYSTGLATGTGTDQIGVASRLNTGTPLTSAGKHSKLGELIGKTVRDAVKGTLALQNLLTPEARMSTVCHLERFGATREGLKDAITAHLSKEEAKLFEANFLVIERDPVVVAAVVALVHLWDQVTWGVLPTSCVRELWATYGAQVASAVSGKHNAISAYRDELARRGYGVNPQEFLCLIEEAIALGFKDKWSDEGSFVKGGLHEKD